MELLSEYIYTRLSFIFQNIELTVGDHIGFTYIAPTMSYELTGKVHGFDLSEELLFMILDDKQAVYGYPLDDIRDLFFFPQAELN